MRPTLSDWRNEVGKGYGEQDLPTELWSAQQAINELELRLRARRKEARADQVVPGVLYHYTDARGFQGMLGSFNMWLSDAAFMNDPLEGSWTHQRASLHVVDVLGEGPLSAQIHQRLEAHLSAPDLWDERVRSDNDSPVSWAAFRSSTTPAYIASFTEQGDLLSQWRGYGAGGEGFAVGFDLKELSFSRIETIPKEFITPTLIKVEYDVERQDAEIRYILTEVRSVFEAHAGALSINPDAEKRFLALFHYLVDDAIEVAIR